VNGEVKDRKNGLFRADDEKFEFWLDKVFFQIKNKGLGEFELLVDNTPFSILLNRVK